MPNNEGALISEVRLIMREYSMDKQLLCLMAT